MKTFLWILAWITLTIAIWPLPLGNYMLALAMVVAMSFIEKMD